MKSFFGLGLLSSLALGKEAPIFPQGPVNVAPSLQDVYGDAWKAGQSPAFFNGRRSPQRRTKVDCTFPLEIIVVQDNTASFQDDFYNMRDQQLDLMVAGLTKDHPNSKFGVVSFRDKPVYSLGNPEAGDYCLRFEAPLSSNVTALKAVYDQLMSNGGADPSESQFTAIVAAAQSATPGWSTLTSDEVTRLIVVATDAPPHFADDGLNVYGMAPFSGVFKEAEADVQCLAEYYPDPAQVKEALNARQAYLAVLVYDGAYWETLPSRSWTWMNTFLGQPNEFVTSLAEDSSNFWERLSHAIKAIEQLECVDPSTPAPPTQEPLPPCEPCAPCPDCVAQ